MDGRKYRKTIAQQTVEILHAGNYSSPTGGLVDISGDLEYAQQQSILYTPNDFSNALIPPQAEHDTQFVFLQATTIQAIQTVLSEDTELDIAVLNFASAKNPGGGFLKGSLAQEESLACCTGIYHCINHPRMSKFYDVNRSDNTCLYTHHIIYSPKVPVFRKDDNMEELLSQPLKCSFISSPAVNAGHANGRVGTAKVEQVMMERMDRILGVTALNGHHVIVLGAWGCGVFRNDVFDVARMFRHYLYSPDAKYRSTFSKVIFAIPDSKCAQFEQYFLEEDPKKPPLQQRPPDTRNKYKKKGKKIDRKTQHLNKEEQPNNDDF